MEPNEFIAKFVVNMARNDSIDGIICSRVF
jgi:hypothetical protein